MNFRNTLAACLLGTCPVGIALAAENTGAELDQALARISARCTEQHAYDPASPGDIGEHALAPGEKAWRECVYAAIRSEVAPRSSAPEAYEELIAQDIKFTAAIEAGEMTRFERWQRNRMGKQVVLINEAMTPDETVERQAEMLDDFQRSQMETLLRTTPPQLIRVR